MNMPSELAQRFIHHLDIEYLCKCPNYNDSEHYLKTVEDHMNEYFTIAWSLGGTYGSCWTDRPRVIEPDDEPNTLELNQFLECYYPDLSYVDLDNIRKKFVLNEHCERDYYGGSITTCTKKLSFYHLAEVLIEMIHQDCEEEQMIDFELLLLEHSQIIPMLSIDTYDKFDTIKLHNKLIEDLPNNPSDNSKFKI